MAEQLLRVIAPLCWCDVDGHWVIFQSANGLVCELDELSGLVLSVVEEQASTREALIAKVAQLTEGSGLVSVSRNLGETIDTLLRSGIVEAAILHSQQCG